MTDPQLPGDPMGELSARVDLVGAAIAKHEDALAELRALMKSLLPDNVGQGHKPVAAPHWHHLEG
jgi:hypothetical protein